MANDLLTDAHFMARALELAKLGAGSVSPNPMVGCVIVCDGRIIGEGWHKKYGGPHAEVNAIDSVKDKELLKRATCYVTLEPCAHFGKTPPCADLLVSMQIPKVVVSMKDPNPLVAGKGIEKLRNAGAEVSTGLLEREALELNKRFFCSIEKKRPFIVLKWAQTADGFIARENFDSKWISNFYARQLVHKWRSEEDAFLVGANTALYDNPQLNVRDWSGRNPARVVIDPNLKVPKAHHLFDQSQPTIVYNSSKSVKDGVVEYVKVSDLKNRVEEVVTDLYERKIQSLVVEGGAKTIQSFVELNLWDEARIFTSTQRFVKGVSAPMVSGDVVNSEDFLEDTLTVIKPKKN